MSYLDKQKVEREARQHAGDIRNATRYSEAINRYLGAIGYQETSGAARKPEPRVAAVKPQTGVVVVGVDDTPTSYTAVDHAAIEAELRGWDLRLLHVQHAGGVRGGERDTGARLLERMTDRVHAYSPMVAVTSRLAIGAAAPLLLSDAHDASLVVVGHRHGAAGTAFGLSVGDRVAEHHTGPVLVVRVPGWPPGPDFGTRPIVVGVDESPMSQPAIDFAIAEAHVRGCDVVMLHAAGQGGAGDDRLETYDGIHVHRRDLTGAPVPALIAASGTAAAVVIGRRGSGGFAGTLLGSVSKAMIRHALCPVFLVG